MEPLLSRDEFREAVFVRDGHKCVICKKEGQDAHHIIERRLFPNGGYYLPNGATLCGDCHLRAEETTLSVEEIRRACGLDRDSNTGAELPPILPPHLYPDARYDKWGNPVLDNGTRLRGELFYDASVQKVLSPVLHLFTNRVKYPRTFHLPWSPGMTDDDRMLSPEALASWGQEPVVITEKMDGENTTMYSDYIHARSLEYEPRFDRDRIKALHGRLGWQIDDSDMRICGENLTAKHTLKYTELPSYFMVFGVWIRDVSLPWEDVVTYAGVLELPTVPILWQGRWDAFNPKLLHELMDFSRQEGYVVRPQSSYTLREHRDRVGKYVRKGHVADTHGHWTRRRIEWNGIKEGVI
jgi:hypothetical protein